MLRSLPGTTATGNVRQVPHDHAAVVGRGEVRGRGVGQRQLVSLADHRQPESLRGLAAAQRLTVRHPGHQAVLHHHDRVGGRHRHPHGLVAVQGAQAAGDRGLIQQRAGGVVEQHVALGRPQRGDRPAGQLGPGRPALDDPGHLAVAAQRQQLTDVGRVPGGHHDQGGVHPRSLVERGDRVLQQGPPGQREQLLGERGAETHSRPGRQHHSHRSHERTLPGYDRQGLPAESRHLLMRHSTP